MTDMMNLGFTDEEAWKAGVGWRAMKEAMWIPIVGAIITAGLFLLRVTMSEAISQVARLNSERGSNHLSQVADEISRLHKLKQDGVLSESEFQAAKRKVVG